MKTDTAPGIVRADRPRPGELDLDQRPSGRAARMRSTSERSVP